MTYVQGFLTPVPTDKKDAFRAMAEAAAPIFKEFGAIRIVEAWGDDVPEGKRTDCRRAVQAEPHEAVVFSWLEFPDKATSDAASAAMQTDERMKAFADMPFDGKRMIYSGFETIMDEGASGKRGYLDGMVAAVPIANRAAYLAHARAAAAIFRREGATRLVETWSADVADGKVTDFKRAVDATSDEAIVFSWIEWPDKPTRDAGMQALMEDPAMRDMQMPFDGSRMIYGGFVPVIDTDR